MNFTRLAEFQSMYRLLHASTTLVSIKEDVKTLSQRKSKPGYFRNLQGDGLSYMHKSLSCSSCQTRENPRILHVFHM